MDPILNWKRELTTDEQLAIDLVADERIRLGRAHVDGLVLRRALSGVERDAREQLLENLVPVFLRRGGRDSFMLMPYGALKSKHASAVIDAATRLRGFLQQLFREDDHFQQFTWNTVATRAFPQGADRPLVEYALNCLGTWGGGSNEVWPRPPTEVFEGLLDEEVSLDEVLSCSQRIMIQWAIDAAMLDGRDLPPKYVALTSHNVSGSMTDPKGAHRVDPARAAVRRIVRKFQDVSRQLAIRHSDRSTLTIGDEYDVQDLLHALLRLFFNDVRREEPTPNFAGQAARIDFLLKEHGICIEVKMARHRLGRKELGNELILDIARYKQHPDCGLLICFVYDPNGFVANPRELENDLNKFHDDLEVEVIVVPR